MKARTEAICQSCGARMPRWVGRCPECGEFGTVVEEPVANGASGRGATPVAGVRTTPLASEEVQAGERIPSALDELDLVLGGGLVRGSVVLLAGEPGVGKSTLSLQAALRLGAQHEVLLVCGEEAPQQVKARASRLNLIPSSVQTLATPELPSVLGAIEGSGADVVIVDSIQTVFDPDLPSAPGSVTQVRECGARLTRTAREKGVTVVLVGHVTKDGAVAGPRVLEHLVDVVLHFEGDRSSGVRILRANKNRFGSTQEVGFFEMTSEGLHAIHDASAYLLADRCGGWPGSMLAACVDGHRPFVCEVQALVDDETNTPNPRRTAIGIESSRLPLLAAVLHGQLGLTFGKRDVYVSAVGGIRVTEPAVDLPAAMALLSAITKKPLPEDAVAFGEIGLSGEIRQVVASERRLREAINVGCKRAYVPHNFTTDVAGIEVRRLRHISDAFALINDPW